MELKSEFLEKHYRDDAFGTVQATKLYDSYVTWLKTNYPTETPSTQTAFGRVVGKYYRKKMIEGLVYYCGLSFRGREEIIKQQVEARIALEERNKISEKTLHSKLDAENFIDLLWSKMIAIGMENKNAHTRIMDLEKRIQELEHELKKEQIEIMGFKAGRDVRDVLKIDNL